MGKWKQPNSKAKTKEVKVVPESAPQKATTKEAQTKKKDEPPKKEEPSKKAAKGGKKEESKKTAKGGKKETSEDDLGVEPFACALAEICRVLMMTMESSESDEVEGMLTHQTKFDKGLLKLLPEDARAPMCKLAKLMQGELQSGMLDEEIDSDAEEDEEDEVEAAALAHAAAKKGKAASAFVEAEDDEGEEDIELASASDGELIDPRNFVQFKQFFTKKEAAALVAEMEEGGKASGAIEAAFDAYTQDAEDEDEGDDDEENIEDSDDEEPAWKGE